jgi:hypothetical protein
MNLLGLGKWNSGYGSTLDHADSHELGMSSDAYLVW